jgi:hypothetical protein
MSTSGQQATTAAKKPSASSSRGKKQTAATFSGKSLQTIHNDYNVDYMLSSHSELPQAGERAEVADADEEVSLEQQVTEAIEQMMDEHPECEIFPGKYDSLSLLKQTFDGLLDTYVYGDVESFANPPGITITFATDTGASSSSSSSSTGGVQRIHLPSPTHTYSKSDRMLKMSKSSEVSDYDVQLKPEFEALLQAAEVSPFGLNKETVVDNTVRRAKHLPAEKILDISGFRVEDIVDQVKTVLFPQEPNVVAKVRV